MVIHQKYSIYDQTANCAVEDANTLLLKLIFPLQTSAIEAINHLCLMNYSKTESYSVYYSSANCAVKYVYTVLLNMLISL